MKPRQQKEAEGLGRLPVTRRVLSPRRSRRRAGGGRGPAPGEPESEGPSAAGPGTAVPGRALNPFQHAIMIEKQQLNTLRGIDLM
jgi:hypothetical protein